MATNATSEATHSKSHSFLDCFIQMTPIADDVAINPSQSQKPQMPPLYQVFSPIKGELKMIQKSMDITAAVIKLTTMFQNICGSMPLNFSLPVG